MDSTQTRDLPPEIKALLRVWLRYRRLGILAHNVVGLTGIISSLAAASRVSGDYAHVSAFVAAICIGAMTFYDFRSEFSKFSRAHRVLEDVALRYRYGTATLEDLFNARDLGEAILEEHDRQDRRTSADVLRAAAASGVGATAGNRPTFDRAGQQSLNPSPGDSSTQSGT